MNTNNNVIISDGSGMLTYQAVTSCAPTCHHIGYGDVINVIAIVVVIIATVLFVSRFLQYTFDFINDKEGGSRFFPNIDVGLFEGFGFDTLLILGGVIAGLVCALLWIVAIPLLLIIGLMFFLRYIVRMKKKIDKVTDE